MRDRSFLVVAACFFLSGFAALIYETAWTREFSFVFGTSELAVATVLAAYMAGLAAGAAVGGRVAHRTRRPLALYAFLELGIGLSALLVPVALEGASRLLVLLFGQQSGFGETSQLAISVFYLIATFVIVMIPTSFMGATLPLLSRYAVRHDAEIGPRIGALYSVNTAGAVAGTLTAAFVLLPSLGIRATVHVAVAANVLVFLIAVLLVRIARLQPATAADTVAGDHRATRGLNIILPLMLVSGALSFTYEVLWVRLLSQLLGGSTYAFAAMLGSFLLGIALGSAGASRLADSPDRALRLFVWAQVGIALLSTAAFRIIDYAPAVTRWFGTEYQLLLDISIAMTVLLPSAICIGATFPLAVRVLARNAEDAGPSSSRVYSWNTIGAIVGSIGTAFYLLPTLGFRNTIVFAVSANLAIGIAASFFSDQRRSLLAIPVAIGVLLAVLMPGEPWQVLLSSPLNRTAAPKMGSVGFYEVGRSATVLLKKETPSSWRLSSNGLPESLVSIPESPPTTLKTALMLGAIGPLLRPEARSMLVVGLGGGVTVERIPQNIEEIDVIELEEEVVAANRWLGPRRAFDPLSDPRVHLHINDARSALFLSTKRFDVIAAQASHPWTGGASHLYTGEFFELVSEHLTDHGVFVQWVGRAFVDLDLIKSLVGTLLDHFAYVHVYREILFVASNSPIPNVLDLEALRALDPEISRTTGIYIPEDFATYLLMDAKASARFADGAARTSDNRNLLQMRSPKIHRLPGTLRSQRQQAIARAYVSYNPLPRLVDEGQLEATALVQRLYAGNQPHRSVQVIRTLDDPTDRDFLRMLGPRNSPTRLGLEKYLRKHPGDPTARANLLRLNLATSEPGNGARSLPPGDDFSASERAFFDASVRSREKDWGGVEIFDARLAAILPKDPLYRDAVFLRAKWRIESGIPSHARNAIEIIDDALRAARSNQLLILRSGAAAALDDPLTVIVSLAEIKINKDGENAEQLRNGVRSMLSDLIVEGELADWRDELLRTTFSTKAAGGEGVPSKTGG